MSGFYLGPAGGMVPIPAPTPGMTVGHAQPTTLVTPLDGLPVVYRSPVQARTWTLEYNHRSPFEVADLVALSRHPGPLYLLEPSTTRSNMLTMESAEPGRRVSGSGFVAGWTGVKEPGEVFGSNQITDPSFEDGDYWAGALSELLSNDGDWYVTSSYFRTGSFSLRCNFTGPNSYQYLHSPVQVRGGETIRWSAWVRSGAGGASPSVDTHARASLRITHAGGSTSYVHSDFVIIGEDADWHQLIDTATMPQDARQCAMYVTIREHGNTGAAMIDDVNVSEALSEDDMPQYLGWLETPGDWAYAHAVPAVPGQIYTASVRVLNSADLILQSLNRDGTRTNIAVRRAGSGHVSVTGITPAEVQQLRIVMTPVDGPAGIWHAQLTETEHHVPWHPGLGVPIVVFTDGYEQAVQAAWGTTTRSNYTFNLTETA